MVVVLIRRDGNVRYISKKYSFLSLNFGLNREFRCEEVTITRVFSGTLVLYVQDKDFQIQLRTLTQRTLLGSTTGTTNDQEPDGDLIVPGSHGRSGRFVLFRDEKRIYGRGVGPSGHVLYEIKRRMGRIMWTTVFYFRIVKISLS